MKTTLITDKCYACELEDYCSDSYCCLKKSRFTETIIDKTQRAEAEQISKTIKKRFWGLESNSMHGILYDDTADILYDLHQVIRHQLWLDKPESKKSHITVDASEAMQVGDEPLAIIEREEI